MIDRKKTLIGAGVAAVILLAAGAAIMYGRREDAAVQGAFEKLAAAERYHMRSALELRLPVKLRGRERPIQRVDITLDKDVAWRDNGVHATGTLNIEASGRGMVLFANGDVRLFPDQTAFLLHELPALLNPSGHLINKWTYVKAPVTGANNPAEIREAFMKFFTGWQDLGESQLPTDGSKSARHFYRTVTAEQEDILYQVFRQSRSGSRALHTVARLLKAFNIASVDMWIDPKTDEVTLLKIIFVHPERQEEGAELTLSFSDYGKQVQLSEPPQEFTVSPEVFAQIFGGGEIEQLP